MQTVPPGRVQAVRVVEPLLWRGSGWARIDVTVAGYVGERQALSSVLLPVAPRHIAIQMVGLVFPGTNPEAVPLLPARRSWLAPFGAGEAGTDDSLFVTRRGRVCRRLDVIAHARAQSVRLTAGPLQRLFGIGTVHIDAPPGPVQVAAENRDAGVTANVILPGTMDTPANRMAMPGEDFSNWVQPANVARLAVWLASDSAKEINGAAIPVYGNA